MNPQAQPSRLVPACGTNAKLYFCRRIDMVGAPESDTYRPRAGERVLLTEAELALADRKARDETDGRSCVVCVTPTVTLMPVVPLPDDATDPEHHSTRRFRPAKKRSHARR